MKNLTKFKYPLLYLVVFTLPMYMRINNILLGVFVVLCLIDLILHKKTRERNNIVQNGWPVLSLFVLAIIAVLVNWEPGGIKYLEKYWSFLFIPIALLSDDRFHTHYRRRIFLSLLWGCVLTLVICYGNAIWSIIAEGGTWRSLFEWYHVGSRFTEVADTHPIYLGLFIVTSILFLIQDKDVSPYLKYGLLLFLILGLFQLASRVALLLFLLMAIYLLVANIQKYKNVVIVIAIGLLISVTAIVYFGSKYLENRLFQIEALSNHRKVAHWQASYEIFREHPFLGVGFAKIKQERKEKYAEFNFEEAAENDYNAHNQFLEYLSVNGALGGFVYAVSLAYVLLLTLYKRDTLFTFIFLAFILTSLTESTLVRIKGIEYFALFTALFLSGAYSNKNPDEHLYHA